MNTARIALTPTTRRDGSALPIAQIASYKLYRAVAQGGPFELLSTSPTAVSLQTVVQGSPYWYRGSCVDTNGQEGDPSVAVNPQYQVEEPPATPSPPAAPSIDLTYL